jgi:ABC-type Zn uptake system ZnuABC Zn-binding protein ZnuA
MFDNFRVKHQWKQAGKFIVFHDAYNYLLESVWIENDFKIPFSRNILNAPSTAHIVKLIEEVKLHSIKYMFQEPQSSQGDFQKFAAVYNLKVAILDPIWVDDSAGWYIENLQINLNNLSKIYE